MKAELKFSKILEELKEHAPFTFAGALVAVVLMFLLSKFSWLSSEQAEGLFEIFHPLHVILSAMVTAGMYTHNMCNHERKLCYLPSLFLLGIAGSIGIATLSDSIIPYWSELLLGFKDIHAHIEVLEKPLTIISAAVFGVVIAWYSPTTKFPHMGHIFLSTSASLFHIYMNVNHSLSIIQYFFVSIFLFFAVWLPCCISDIVFPLLFLKKKD